MFIYKSINLPSAMLYASAPKRWKYKLYQYRAEECERPFELFDHDESSIAILFPLILKNEYYFTLIYINDTI